MNRIVFFYQSCIIKNMMEQYKSVLNNRDLITYICRDHVWVHLDDREELY